MIEEKRWDLGKEMELMEKWIREGRFKFKDDGGKIYAIDTPPPYVSGESIHPGQLAHYVLIDMIARAERLLGRNVLFPCGMDRNGIPVEMLVIKKYGDVTQLGREKFVELCKKELDNTEGIFLKTFKRVGMSWDWDEPYRTDSPQYRAITQATFIDLYKKGLIYKEYRPTIWCPKCKTTLAEAEVTYVEKTTTLHYIKFKVKETGEDLIIATTRPELLGACQAVLVHPNDERYTHLHGKHAIIPLYNRPVPIIAHEYAKPEFGTGAVMICSFGDLADVRLFRELNLEPIELIDKEGRMTERALEYKGLTIKDAREKIVKDLEDRGLVIKKEPTIHNTPIHDRCDTEIEFIQVEEWYLSQLKFKEQIKRIADEMEFIPERHKQILLDWIEALIIDWPISKTRYYATEVPVWYCGDCGEVLLPEPGRYYQPWKEKVFERCPSCGSQNIKGEERVFDTWFDSSISNLFISRYLRDESFFNRAYPVYIRPQGRDIIRTWLYYTLLRNYLLTGKNAFKKVWITGMGLDEHGRKMSKSRGNFFDPMPVVDKYGADAYRFFSAAEANVGEDYRVSIKRVEGAAKFLTKLWNVARFISRFERKSAKELKEADKWILGELSKLVKECKQGYEQLNFFIPANKIRNFVWDIFAPHYIEMVKWRAYEGDESALYTLHTVLETVLILLSPITPFMTDTIMRKMYGKSIYDCSFPESPGFEEYSKFTQELIDFNSMVWRMKKERGLSLKDPIEVEIPAQLKIFEQDLVNMHHLK